MHELTINQRYIPGIAMVIIFFVFMGIVNFHYKNEHFQGKVVGKHRNIKSRNAMHVTVDGWPDDVYISNDKLYKRVNVGDYLIKEKGEWTYLLIKGTDTEKYEDPRF